MAKLLTSAQMRQADRRTIEELGLPGAVLMENAGQGVVRTIRHHYGTARRILVLAGRGNNGGDGFVVARHLMQQGLLVRVLLLGREEGLKGDAALNHQIYRRLGGWLQEVVEESSLHALLVHSEVVVDALFGTGLSKPLGGVAAAMVHQVNGCNRPVVAVDLPSGVCADTGQVLGVAVQAHHTVTFGAEKIAHRTWPGAGLCGRITLVDIGIPHAFLDLAEHQVARNLPGDLAIPPRRRDGHKGVFGHTLVVAGSIGKAGAAILSARGAQATGAGLVTVACPATVQPQVASQLTEAMTWPLPEQAGWITPLREAFQGIGSLAVGPGLGQEPSLTRTVAELLQAFDVPAVVDADGLNALARDPERLRQVAGTRLAPLVITPHPGEMARLLAASVAQVQQDRLATALECARLWRVWVVLKGAATVIASPQGEAWINDNGNSGLAAGGSGDLLTGVMAGLLAQGWFMASAVRGAVWLHGAAADRAARKHGAAGLLASELPRHVRKLRNQPPFAGE